MPPKLQSLLDDLAMFPDGEDRKLLFVDLAREYVAPTTDEVPHTPENRIPGCESEVYFRALDGHFSFAVANPQALLAKAFARVLTQGLDGRLTTDIPIDLPYMVFGALSVGKSLGLTNMVYMIRNSAKAS